MSDLITVSIVTYKTDKDELEKCLLSMESALVKVVYIIDNSPNDDLKEFCLTFSKVVYVFNDDNIGYGAAHNIAIRKAMGVEAVYHLVINSDVYFEGKVIDDIVGYMGKNLDVAQLIPNVTYPNGELQYVCRLLPTPLNLIFRRFLPASLVEKMNYRYLIKFNDHKKPMNVPYHMGCFMFFRMSAFDKVGLFDERFFMYPEDIDITRRMHRHYRTMFWPEATVIHAHRAASYKNKKMLKIHAANMIKYFNKWGWFFDSERRRVNKRLLKELGCKK